MFKGLFKKGYCRNISFEFSTKGEDIEYELKSFSGIDIEDDRLYINFDCLDLEFEGLIHGYCKKYPNMIQTMVMDDTFQRILINLTYFYLDELTKEERVVIFQLPCMGLIKSGLKQAKIHNGNIDNIQYIFETRGIGAIGVK